MALSQVEINKELRMRERVIKNLCAAMPYSTKTKIFYEGQAIELHIQEGRFITPEFIDRIGENWTTPDTIEAQDNHLVLTWRMFLK